MADEKAKIVTDATGPSSGPAPAQPEVDAQVSKQEQSAPEAPTPDKAEAPAQEAPAQDKAADAPKAIADLSVETLSSQQIELLSGYLDDWENISFEDKRKAADGLISSISATSDYVKIEWKI